MVIKNLVKSAAITALVIGSGSALAGGKWALHPYAGLEYKINYMQGKTHWHKILPTNKPFHNFGLLGGIKLHDCASVELGYMRANRKTKESDISGKNYFNATAGASVLQRIKLKVRDFHFDINGTFPASEGFALVGTLGVGSVKVRPIAERLGTTNTNIEALSGVSRLVPRVGLGTQYTQGMFGVRGRLLWEGTNRLRIKRNSVGAPFSTASEKAFKDSLGFNISAFVRW